MKISVNGQEVSFDSPCTVEQLLDRQPQKPRACAVEVNRTLVPRKRHAEHALQDGDTVEIVTLVGGG
jgi:thiamine biosynthesis protein ThiS